MEVTSRWRQQLTRLLQTKTATLCNAKEFIAVCEKYLLLKAFVYTETTVVHLFTSCKWFYRVSDTLKPKPKPKPKLTTSRSQNRKQEQKAVNYIGLYGAQNVDKSF